jgi:hypothetical protein
MDCDHLDSIVESIADGEAGTGAAEVHVRGCARCQSRIRLAVAIDRMLLSRETPRPPEGFTAGVMQRIGQERWRSEQWVDAAFNAAMAAGVALAVAGAADFAIALGWFTLAPPTVEAIGVAIEPWLSAAAAEMRTILTAGALLSSALALWWWVEGEASF